MNYFEMLNWFSFFPKKKFLVNSLDRMSCFSKIWECCGKFENFWKLLSKIEKILITRKIKHTLKYSKGHKILTKRRIEVKFSGFAPLNDTNHSVHPPPFSAGGGSGDWNWEIFTKNLVTFKRWDGFNNDEKPI